MVKYNFKFTPLLGNTYNLLVPIIDKSEKIIYGYY